MRPAAADAARDIPPARGAAAAGTPLRLVYTGKFAPRWNTLEMTELPGLLSARGIASELHMAGDKIHDDASGYQQRMRSALDTERRDARRALAGGGDAARRVL